jgi:hypothetical protein
MQRVERHWRPYAADPTCVLYLPFYKYGANAQKIWDQSGKGNHGIITGAAPATLGWAFDGTDDVVDCGNGSSLQITGAISYSVWVRPRNTSVYNGILNKGDDVTYEFTARSDGKMDVYITDGTHATHSYTVAVDLNQWQLWTCSFTPTGSLYVYKNGALVDTVSGSSVTAIANTSDHLKIGKYSSYYFNGNVGEVLVFNRALSASEIRSYYEKTRHIYGV